MTYVSREFTRDVVAAPFAPN